jgi:hypothetical protein
MATAAAASPSTLGREPCENKRRNAMTDESEHFADAIEYKILDWIAKTAASGGDPAAEAKEFDRQLRRETPGKYQEWAYERAARLLSGELRQAREKRARWERGER